MKWRQFLPHIEEKDRQVGLASLVVLSPQEHLDPLPSRSHQQSKNKTTQTILR